MRQAWAALTLEEEPGLSGAPSSLLGQTEWSLRKAGTVKGR